MMSQITIKDQQEYFSSPSLQDICIQFCVGHAKTLLLAATPSSSVGTAKLQYKLQKSVSLPNDVWESILTNFDNLSEDYLPLVQAVHNKVPSLRRIHVPNSLHLKDEDLQLIMQLDPISLDINNCPTLTKKSVDIINKFGRSLDSLCIGTSTQIIPTNLDNWLFNHKAQNEEHGIRKVARTIGQYLKGKFIGKASDCLSEDSSNSKVHGLLMTPKLRKLVIWGHHITQTQQVRRSILVKHGLEDTSNPIDSPDGDTSSQDNLSPRVAIDYWEYLTRDFIGTLEHLDLSSCQEIMDLNFLLEATESLKTLQLHDVLLDYDSKTWEVLKHFRKLKFLDVSQYNELASVFPNPDVILDKLVVSLPELEGLDISGTNLAGFDHDPRSNQSTSSIAGLASRKDKPLFYLGLLSTHYNASSRANIPARQVAGSDSIPQLILAMKMYLHRDNILRKAIRMLHEKLQHSISEKFIPCYTILDLLLDIMKIHIEDKHTVIVSMAACFHLLKQIVCGVGADRIQGVCEWRLQRTVDACVRAMNVHPSDLSLMRNGILNLLVLKTRSLNKQRSYSDEGAFILAILNAGVAATSIGNLADDIFLIKSIAHLLYMTLKSCDKNNQKKMIEFILENDAVEKLIQFVDELLNKRVFEQMTTFWIILLKILNGGFIATSSDNNLKHSTTNYKRFAKASVVDICFKLLKICNEERLDDEFNSQIRSLREVRKSVLAFLSNLLYNAGSQAEVLIIQQQNIKQVVKILGTTAVRDEELLHVSCGFLSHVASKDESFDLENPSRSEILTGIGKVMSKMNLSHRFTFTFRNLTQLYDLLKVQDAPEIHIWVLWTLIKLTENNIKYVDMIINDEKLNLSTLSQQYSSMEGGYRCQKVLIALRDHLSSILDRHYASETFD